MKWKMMLWALLFGTMSVFGPGAARAQGEVDDDGIEMEGDDGPGGDDMWGPRRGGGGPGMGMGHGREGRFHGRPGMERRGKMRKRMGKRVREHMKDPEVKAAMKAKREAHMKVKTLAQALREGKGDKKKAEADLKAALGEAFEADIAAHEIHLKKMESQIKKLKTRITKRRGMKDKIVEKKFGEIIGDEEGWDW